MSYEIHADHGQEFLLAPSLEDWVPSDHMVRFIRDFVAELDLDGLGFHRRAGEPGRPNYSSELLLGVWLYGYLEKIRSSRKLEHACRTQLPLIWLTGMHYPDHNSLWRFWRAHRASISGVFRQSVQVARRMGLVGMVAHALDGTKINVHACPKAAWHRADLESLAAAIDESIAAMETAVEAEQGMEQESPNLPGQLAQARQRRAAIQQALATLAAEEQEHLLAAEPQARLMKSNGRSGWFYNGQAVVDDAHGIVVAQDVTNQAFDCEQLSPMLEQARHNTGGVARFTVADAGYRNARQEMFAQEQGHTVVLPDHGCEGDASHPFHKSHFQYDEPSDCYVCPQGKNLRYTHTLPPKGHRTPARVYRCRDYKTCPVRGQCSSARFGRTLIRDERQGFRDAQRLLRQQPLWRELLKRRQGIIENLFGNIKENLAFRRWTACGIQHARAQWAMLCLSVNLKKIHQAWKAKLTPPKGAKTKDKPLFAPGNQHLARRQNHWRAPYQYAADHITL